MENQLEKKLGKDMETGIAFFRFYRVDNPLP